MWTFDEISQTIKITKISNGQGQTEPEIKIFDIEQMNEDNFKLIYQKEEQTFSNPPVFFSFCKYLPDQNKIILVFVYECGSKSRFKTL